jgi:iron complex outermembrane receptor protein
MLKKTRLSSGIALAFGGLALSLGMPAVAQDNQRIEITGSATKRIEAESTLPVTIITREDIARSGAATAAELIDRIASNNGGGYNQVLAIGDSARPGFAGASLRGLGSNTTLVLLNGRRLAVYAFDGGGTDLNSIALGAIERVEVLRDGASALYGTDAIAGVMNFITRKDFRGFDANVAYRSPEKSGGTATTAALTAGFGDLAKGGFNIFGNLTYDKFDALKASQREFSKSAFLPNAEGGRIDRTSGNTFPASIFVPGVGTVNPGIPNCLPPVSFITAASGVGACRFDYASVIDILPPQEKLGGLVRATLQMGSAAEVFAEANKTQTTTTFNISPTPASGATTFFGDSLLYPAGGKWYPQAVNPATGKREPGLLWFTPASNDGQATYFQPLSGDLDLFWRTVDAGPRSNQAKADQDRFLLGVKGTVFGKWDYDAAVMRSTSKVTESYVGGYFSETRLLRSTCTDKTTPCGPLNPTYTAGTMDPAINPFGPNDAAGLAALRAAQIIEPVRISKSTRESVDGRISGELGALPAGPISVALGAEQRTEKFNDQPLAVLQTGDIIGGGGNQAPISGKRTVSAVFGEAVLPIMKGVEALAQVRYDRYSDFGATTNPKIGLRWTPTKQLLIRASTGTGFRAPTLPDLLAPQTQTNTGDSYNDPYYEARVGDCYDSAGSPTVNFNPRYCNAQLTVKQGGNPNLKPEESRQSVVGLVFQPTKDVQFSVDVWNIKMEKQIGIPDADGRLAEFIQQFVANPGQGYDPTTSKLTAAGKAALSAGATGAGIVRSASGNLDYVSAQFDNISNSDVKGVDLSVSAVLARTSLGRFSGTLESTYMDSWKQGGTDFVGVYASFGPVVRWRHSVTLDWDRGPWSASLTHLFQTGYRDQGDTRDVGNYERFNAAMAYRGIKNLTLRFGIDNILDRNPPFTRQGDYFHVGYDPTYGNPLGRTYRLAAQYSFK